MSIHEKCIAALRSIATKFAEDFQKWQSEEEWDDENLFEEFVEGDIEQCEFINRLDENGLITTKGEPTLIWNALHNALSPPEEHKTESENESTSMRSVVVELLSPHVHSPMDEAIRKRIEARIKAQAPLMSSGTKKKRTFDILHVEYIGYQNKNYPLLLHFVDSYVRCQMNQWILNGKQTDAQCTFTTSEFFSAHCKNTCFTEFLSGNQSRMDIIESAMASYQHRVLPCFQFMHPTFKIIDTNPLKTSNYFFEMARIVLKCASQPIYNLVHIIPVQIDFILVKGKIEAFYTKPKNLQGISELFGDMPESSESDHESKQNDIAQTQCFPMDIGGLLKANKIEHNEYANPSQDLLRCTEGIKKLSANKRCTRSVFIIDQRPKKDKLYLFRPSDPQYNKFEDNEQELIHCSLHHNTIKYMVPGKGKKPSYSALDCVRGQMFVISFHVMSKEEIRCYIFYQGQCFRFYGEDLINVLPIFFLDGDEARRKLLTAYNHNQKWRESFDQFCDAFVDKRFDAFYYGLTGRLPRIDVVTEKT